MKSIVSLKNIIAVPNIKLLNGSLRPDNLQLGERQRSGLGKQSRETNLRVHTLRHEFLLVNSIARVFLIQYQQDQYEDIPRLGHRQRPQISLNEPEVEEVQALCPRIHFHLKRLQNPNAEEIF